MKTKIKLKPSKRDSPSNLKDHSQHTSSHEASKYLSPNSSSTKPQDTSKKRKHSSAMNQSSHEDSYDNDDDRYEGRYESRYNDHGEGRDSLEETSHSDPVLFGETLNQLPNLDKWKKELSKHLKKKSSTTSSSPSHELKSISKGHLGGVSTSRSNVRNTVGTSGAFDG